MSNPTDNLRKIRGSIPDHVTIVAVSKTVDPERIMELYNSGQRAFGENRAQELITKQPRLPGDIEWHFIGHLQTNKVKNIIPFVHMIQSVDSLKLLAEINRQAEKHGRTIDCLLQFHIATEETKFGLDWEEAQFLLKPENSAEMTHVRFRGVMGMATFTEDTTRVHREFRSLKEIFGRLKNTRFRDHDEFSVISMGMTSDYLIAIEEGSTMIRIGTAIFG
ncbi:MAG: YggS family pyridoxal phosphate-dependent enzyme [Bacteroidales bacterium]|nr:YggS family pyridoxal phosphate-dependent enzyme [Bacteroidales bacterium]